MAVGIVRLLYAALAVPWVWNTNQIYAVILVLVWGAAAMRWFLIWRRSPEEARTRWDKFSMGVFDQFSNPSRAKLNTTNVVVWMAVAIALLVLLNLPGH